MGSADHFCVVELEQLVGYLIMTDLRIYIIVSGDRKVLIDWNSILDMKLIDLHNFQFEWNCSDGNSRKKDKVRFFFDEKNRLIELL